MGKQKKEGDLGKLNECHVSRKSVEQEQDREKEEEFWSPKECKLCLCKSLNIMSIAPKQ